MKGIFEKSPCFPHAFHKAGFFRLDVIPFEGGQQLVSFCLKLPGASSLFWCKFYRLSINLYSYIGT